MSEPTPVQREIAAAKALFVLFTCSIDDEDKNSGPSMTIADDCKPVAYPKTL